MNTDIMREELERVVMKGNPDKITVQKISAILWELETRLIALEKQQAAAATPEPTPEPVPEPTPGVKVDPAMKVDTAKPRARRPRKAAAK